MQNSFQFFMKENLLSVGSFDPATGVLKSLDRRTGKEEPLQFGSSPILTLWDHTVGAMPQDAFLWDNGQLREAQVATRMEPGSIWLEASFEGRVVWERPGSSRDPKEKAPFSKKATEGNTASFYPEPELNRALEAAAMKLAKKDRRDWLFFPVAALRCLCQLHALSHGGFGALCIEAGPAAPGRIMSLDEALPCISPEPLHLASSIASVDALFRCCWQGEALVPPKRHAHTRIRLAFCETHGREHTHFGYDEFVRRFSVDDLRALVHPF